MKKLTVLLISAVLLASCGGTDSKSLAKEVCDCYKKANGMDAADPKRSAAQNECVKKQGDGWDKVKDNQANADEFNKIIGDCSKDMLNQSLGK